MATPRAVVPQLLVVAAFSRHDAALEWGRSRLEEIYGPIALQSRAFVFNQTAYYEPTMGADLKKPLWAFQTLVDPACLADVKVQTNALEQELAERRVFPEPRPLNLDPGLLSLGKFILATTKDQAHRLYLRDGIFAEVTLRYYDGAFDIWPWTYADYQTREVRDWLNQARTIYRQRLSEHQSEERHHE